MEGSSHLNDSEILDYETTQFDMDCELSEDDSNISNDDVEIQ